MRTETSDYAMKRSSRFLKSRDGSRTAALVGAPHIYRDRHKGPYGVPVRFGFDNPDVWDEEYGFEISNFTVSQ